MMKPNIFIAAQLVSKISYISVQFILTLFLYEGFELYIYKSFLIDSLNTKMDRRNKTTILCVTSIQLYLTSTISPVSQFVLLYNPTHIVVLYLNLQHFSIKIVLINTSILQHSYTHLTQLEIYLIVLHLLL